MVYWIGVAVFDIRCFYARKENEMDSEIKSV